MSDIQILNVISKRNLWQNNFDLNRMSTPFETSYSEAEIITL